MTDEQAKKLLIAAIIASVVGDDWSKLKELASNAEFIHWLIEKLL